MTTMGKTCAVIQVWRRGAGYGPSKGPSHTDDTFEKVHWFDALEDAIEWFNHAPQGQTATDGECNRLLVKVFKRLK